MNASKSAVTTSVEVTSPASASTDVTTTVELSAKTVAKPFVPKGPPTDPTFVYASYGAFAAMLVAYVITLFVRVKRAKQEQA